MKNYSIMPLLTDHVEEISQDVVAQYKNGTATLALFCMTMVPEGDPVIDKATLLCEKYVPFRDRIRELGYDSGILVQATIGHGYPLNQLFPFQQKVALNSGVKEFICCPYDENYRRFMRKQFATLASYGPKEIMVDDDHRLMHTWGRGCACPLHMAAFNKKAGTNMTREELYAHTQGSSELDRHYTRIFIETQLESVVGAAKAYREGIDSVDPTIAGSFCSSGEAAEFGVEIATVLAGKGNPIVVRLNNDNYHPAGVREFSISMYKAAIQSAVMNGRADVILAETDTCPHNRYSTAAHHLHSHFTGSILEGAGGCKHWITRMHTYEPNSGKAYRKILGKHRGFYEALSKLRPSLKWLGCRIPVSTVPDYGLQNPNIWELENDGFSTNVLERFGLPMYFSAQPGGAVFIDGFGDWRFTDEEITEFFKGTVFLAAETAKRLNERGFLQYTGVEVREWNKPLTGGASAIDDESIAGQKNPMVSGELVLGKEQIVAQKNPMELVPINDSVRWDSTAYHLHNGTEKQPLFPAVTVYRNPLGGTSVVFCGTPKTKLHHSEGFSFLNEVRKKQFIRLLQETGNLPVYYPDDAEVYFKAAEAPNGELFCAFFNICMDPIEEITLVCDREITKIEKLTETGDRVPVEFTVENGVITVQEPAHILTPVMLFLS